MTISSRPIERGAPRVRQTGPIAWTKKHLFNSPFNSVLTVVLGGLILYVLYSLLSWAFVQAPWAVVTENFAQYMVGLYPPDFYWRVWAIFALVLSLAGVSWGILARNQKQIFWLWHSGAVASYFANDSASSSLFAREFGFVGVGCDRRSSVRA